MTSNNAMCLAQFVCWEYSRKQKRQSRRPGALTAEQRGGPVSGSGRGRGAGGDEMRRILLGKGCLSRDRTEGKEPGRCLGRAGPGQGSAWFV